MLEIVFVDCLKLRQRPDHRSTPYKTMQIYIHTKMRGPGSVELGESKEFGQEGD